MTISGMTGFARTEGASEGLAWSWEARSVNGKGLDIRLRLPSGYDRLEAKTREAVQARFKRGSVSIGLQLKRDAVEQNLRVDIVRAAAFAEAARKLARRGLAKPIDAGGLMAMRGVVDVAAAQDDEDARARLDVAMLASLNEAIEALGAARDAEGAALTPVLSDVIDRIAELRADAARAAADAPEMLKQRLNAKLSELIEQDIDPQRLAAEVAILASKADVREELDRLSAHIDAAREMLGASGPVGRKLDFLSQEFMREANTLCSKSADIALTRIGLDLKAAIEQFREQVQNVE